MNNINQTEHDAFIRVLEARIGSLASESTDDYLINLEHYVLVWLDEIKNELQRRSREANKKADVV